MLGIRGRRMSMILQDPKFSLNPVKRVGDQIAEAYLVHHRVPRAEAKKEGDRRCSTPCSIRDPERIYNLYPHEVSGGMGQRIMIAMMLIPEPDLIIADEPTSALDVTVRLQVLSILDDLVTRRGIGLIFISHDLNLVRGFCDRVLIMYAGRVVEAIEAEEPAATPSIPTPAASWRRSRASAATVQPLPVLQRDPAWRLRPEEPVPCPKSPSKTSTITLGFGAAAKPILHDVGFTVRSGESFGLVGESGSGKSTILRCIAGS